MIRQPTPYRSDLLRCAEKDPVRGIDVVVAVVAVIVLLGVLINQFWSYFA